MFSAYCSWNSTLHFRLSAFCCPPSFSVSIYIYNTIHPPVIIQHPGQKPKHQLLTKYTLAYSKRTHCFDDLACLSCPVLSASNVSLKNCLLCSVSRCSPSGCTVTANPAVPSTSGLWRGATIIQLESWTTVNKHTRIHTHKKCKSRCHESFLPALCPQMNQRWKVWV